jgi:hypothetical protein
MSIEIFVDGAVCGSMWWPNAPAGRFVRASISDQRDRYSEPGATLRECLLSILMEESRDFQSGEFTADTTITARSTSYTDGRRVTRERYWPITAFPSISDLISPDVHSWDFCAED